MRKFILIFFLLSTPALAQNPVTASHVTLQQQSSAPAAPPAGYSRFYADNAGLLKYKLPDSTVRILLNDTTGVALQSSGVSPQTGVVSLTASDSSNPTVLGVNTSSGYGGKFTSTSNAGLFASSQQSYGAWLQQSGALISNNVRALLYLSRSVTLGSYTATGPLLQIDDTTASTGDLLNVKKQSSVKAKIDKDGLATFNNGVTINGAALTVSSNGIFGNWISAQGNGLRSQNFGKSTQAYGDESTCSGEESTAGLKGTASGYQANAESESCAYGWKTYAKAGSIAFGEGTQVTGNNSIGLGRGASCSTNNSTVIGKNAVSTADNQFVAGGGTDPSEKISNVFFGNGVRHSVPAGFTINGTGGQGTNIVGGDITLAGGQGTGTGTGGSVKIQVAPAGSSGSSSNALTDALVIDSTKLATFSGSVKIGGGDAITKVLTATSSQSVGAVSANSISTFDVTVTGAAAGDVIAIGCPSNLDAALIVSGFVSATDTVTVKIANPTGSGSSSFTGTFRVMVTKF